MTSRRNIFLGIVYILSVSVFFLYSSRRVGQNPNTLPAPSSPADLSRGTVPVSERKPPLGWNEYGSKRYGFSLFAPDSLHVREFDEGGGASTITFEDPGNARGFQIFVVPFALAQVTEERFLRDNPSGVKENAEDITVDGSIGAAFGSKDALLGETYEIWFIQNGYLYEVTTLRPLREWLMQIMQTWEFE